MPLLVAGPLQKKFTLMPLESKLGTVLGVFIFAFLYIEKSLNEIFFSETPSQF